MDFVYNPNIGELITFTGTNYHNGSNADKLETLIDGDINGKTIYGVLVSDNKDSHFYFTLTKKCDIYAYGKYYKDSAGVTPKKIKLYKINEKNEEIFVTESQTKSGEWYLLFKDLHIGKYRVKVDNSENNYCSFTEFQVKTLPEFLLNQNNQYYTIKDNSLVLLENQTLDETNFDINGFSDLNLLTNISNNYKITKQLESNICEFDLDNDIEKVEVV